MSDEKDSRPCYSFRDMSFTVKVKKTPKHIVSDVSGCVKAGEILAILGPSGAGKTTLLNLLTFSASSGVGRGVATLAGSKLTSSRFASECGIVGQVDRLWEFLTARETLQYAAKLCLSSLSQAEQDDRVTEILGELGLDVCAETKVGNELLPGGLSGGQKRRLSIGIALIKSPQLLFLDEPTSGLDSSAAMSTMEFIQKIAHKEGLMVVCTIHQPSAELFETFHNVLIMSHGQVAFSGPQEDLKPFFQKVGRPIPDNVNPADFVLAQVNSEFTNPDNVMEVLDYWKHNAAQAMVANLVAVESKEGSSRQVMSRPGFCSEVCTLMKRQGVLSIRDPFIYIGRSVVKITMLLLVAVLYIETRRSRDQHQVVGRAWMHFFNNLFEALFVCPMVFVCYNEVQTILSEAKNGLVSVNAYLTANLMLQLPIILILTAISYSAAMVGAGATPIENDRFLEALMLFYGLVLCFEFMAQLLGVTFSHPALGIGLFIMYWFVNIVKMGFLLPVDDIVWPMRAFYFIMPLSYSIAPVVYTDFYDTPWAGATLCNSSVSLDPGVPCRFHLNANDEIIQPGWYCEGDQSDVCWGHTGEQVLESLGTLFDSITTDIDVWADFVYLLAIAAALKLLVVIVVQLKFRWSSEILPPLNSDVVQESDSKSTKSNHSAKILDSHAMNVSDAAPSSLNAVESDKWERSSHQRRVSQSMDIKSGSSVVSEQSVFSFRDVVFTTKATGICKQKPGKAIVQGASAIVHSGQMLAILGPSGAGKTTLLNALTLNADYGVATGSVYLNGNALTSERFRKECVFVEQKDLHWMALSTREIVSYAAQLFLPHLNAGQRLSRVNELLEQMGLAHVADTKVGHELLPGGLSGGEKRRLSLAVAMLKRPKLIFLDEPTTSLDSAAAKSVVDFIKAVAIKENLIIVATIHQPSTEVFLGFDHCLLLTRGRVAYSGTVKESIPFFDCPSNTAPADHMLKVLNTDFTEEKECDRYLEKWDNTNDKLVQKISDTETPRDNDAAVSASSNFCQQFCVLLRRNGLLSWRDPTMYVGRAVIATVTLCYFSVLYINSRERTQEQIYFRIVNLAWHASIVSCLACVAALIYNAQFALVRIEVKNGLVSPMAWFLSNAFIQIPCLVIYTVLCFSISGYGIGNFSMVGYSRAIVLGSTFFWGTENAAELMGLVFANPIIGAAAYIVLWLIYFLFSGIYIQSDDVIPGLRLMTYVSPLRYVMRSWVFADLIPDYIYGGADTAGCEDLGVPGCIYHGDSVPGWTCDDPTIFCWGATKEQILLTFQSIMSHIESEDRFLDDVILLVIVGASFKLLSALYVKYELGKSNPISPLKSN